MKTIKPLPPIEELKKLLHYEPDTGFFRWKINVSKKIKANSVAGSLHGLGYIDVK